MQFVPVDPQKLIINHLGTHANALLFVGMGIGKSAACLHTLNEMFWNGEIRAALIVGPLRVINLTWPMEIAQWDQFRWMRVNNLRDESGQRAFLNGRGSIYAINYESLPVLADLVSRRGGTIPYDVVIFDESTKAKNPGSKRINLYRKKVPRAGRQWALTGTPMPNSWLDLFAQVRLVDGGQRLGTNFLNFKETYFFGSDFHHHPWQAKNGAMEAIEEKIADITLTLKSSDWLDIPDTHIEDVDVHLTSELISRYRRLEKKLVIELRQDKIMNVASAATLVTKLLQFTSGHMYDDEKGVHPIHNLKFDQLAKINKAEKAPILVASIFQHEQARIREQFPEARFFADAKNAEQQMKLLTAWNEKKIKMLVAHPASIGHGLNLQHGSNVIVWTSLTYARELYEQFICRLYRRGQTEITKVYRLICPDTVDEAVAEALASKAENEARLITALQMLESYRTTK